MPCAQLCSSWFPPEELALPPEARCTHEVLPFRHEACVFAMGTSTTRLTGLALIVDDAGHGDAVQGRHHRIEPAQVGQHPVWRLRAPWHSPAKTHQVSHAAQCAAVCQRSVTACPRQRTPPAAQPTLISQFFLRQHHDCHAEAPLNPRQVISACSLAPQERTNWHLGWSGWWWRDRPLWRALRAAPTAGCWRPRMLPAQSMSPTSQFVKKNSKVLCLIRKQLEKCTGTLFTQPR